jgi:hypothetical protein
MKTITQDRILDILERLLNQLGKKQEILIKTVLATHEITNYIGKSYDVNCYSSKPYQIECEIVEQARSVDLDSEWVIFSKIQFQ